MKDWTRSSFEDFGSLFQSSGQCMGSTIWNIVKTEAAEYQNKRRTNLAEEMFSKYIVSQPETQHHNYTIGLVYL